MAEVLLAIIVLAFFIERALALIFEHRLYVTYLKEKGLKEVTAFVVSFGIVRFWEFDAVSVFLKADETSLWGYLVTAAIIAGGSKASIALFHDFLKVKSQALKKADTA